MVKSALTAETLALVEAVESSFWIKTVYEEVLPGVTLPIYCYTDNRSLSEAVYSSKLLTDKRLCIDIAILREMIAKNEVESVTWVHAKFQLADILTKEGVHSKDLVTAISHGAVVLQ